MVGMLRGGLPAAPADRGKSPSGSVAWLRVWDEPFAPAARRYSADRGGRGAVAGRETRAGVGGLGPGDGGRRVVQPASRLPPPLPIFRA